MPVTTANVQPEYDQARAAVDAFKRITPQLNALARSITGNKKVRVVPGDGSYTDGTTITILPPLSLARKSKHVRYLCNELGEDGLSLCRACKSRSELMSVLMHEIHHIAFGSFSRLDFTREMQRISLASQSASAQLGYDTRVAVERGISKAKANSMVEFINQLPDSHLKTLYLFTEDLRINEQGWRARPGIRAQAWAVEQGILDNGARQHDGEIMFWQDQPQDSQIMAAVLFAAQGHNILGHFDTKVCEAVFSDDVHPYIISLPHAVDVYDTAVQTIGLLDALRWLDFLKETISEEDAAAQDAANADAGETADDDGGAGDGSSDTDDAPEQGLGDPADGDGVSGDPGTSSPSRRSATEEELKSLLTVLLGHDDKINASETDDGDSSDEAGAVLTDADKEKLSALVSTMQFLDRVPRNVASVVEHERGEGELFEDSYRRWNDTDWSPAESIVGKAVTHARIAFTNNARVQHHRNERSGRIAGNVLGKRAALGDDRLFRRKTVPDKRNYHVMMGLDASYSMADGTMTEVKRAVRALGDVCQRTGVSFSIYAHSSGRDANADTYDTSLFIYKIKGESEPWSPEIKNKLATIQPVNGNLDGHSIQYYRKQLDKVKATDKILMYFTDGAMPAENYSEELEVLQTEIELFKRRSYTLLGVGLGTDSPRAHGLDTVCVNSEADYPKVVQHMSKVLIKKGK